MILFATSPKDAMDFCAAHELDFDSIKWYRSPRFVDQATLDGVDDVLVTTAFEDTPEYVEVRGLLK